MKYLVYFFIFLCSFSVKSQIQNPEFRSLSDLEYYVRTNNRSYNEAEGSRYLRDDFVPAKINGILKTQLIRFNVPDNVIEVKTSANKIMALSFSEGYRIQLQDGSGKVYETSSFLNKDGKKETSFFEKTYQDKNFTLYLKENISFVPAKKARSGYEPAVPAKFVRGDDTFFVIGLASGSSLPEALPKKRKPFLGLFGDHSRAIEKKIKSEKLDIKNGEDLQAILKHYFELL